MKVLVIGKGGRRILRERALGHIGGLTCGNEGSVRDWMRHGKFNVTQGKNFDRSGSIGPVLVTAEEFARFDDIRVTTRVNGEVRQNSNTRHLIFNLWDQIEHLSQAMTLEPGDVIFTGTPGGVGAAMKPPLFLKPGDRVRVEIEKLGTLEAVCKAEG